MPEHEAVDATLAACHDVLDWLREEAARCSAGCGADHGSNACEFAVAYDIAAAKLEEALLRGKGPNDVKEPLLC